MVMWGRYRIYTKVVIISCALPSLHDSEFDEFFLLLVMIFTADSVSLSQVNTYTRIVMQRALESPDLPFLFAPSPPPPHSLIAHYLLVS